MSTHRSRLFLIVLVGSFLSLVPPSVAAEEVADVDRAVVEELMEQMKTQELLSYKTEDLGEISWPVVDLRSIYTNGVNCRRVSVAFASSGQTITEGFVTSVRHNTDALAPVVLSSAEARVLSMAISQVLAYARQTRELRVSGVRTDLVVPIRHPTDDAGPVVYLLASPFLVQNIFVGGEYFFGPPGDASVSVSEEALAELAEVIRTAFPG